eukprot:NODE_50_length_27150_cov_0.307308.p7 type:complete len:305 gc:universal NODE_50_length_27150_cov_0.307308:11622-10708(-)
MNTNVLVFIACWGGATCLFLQYMLHAYTVFALKTSKIYLLIVTGLILCYLESCLTIVNIFVVDGNSTRYTSHSLRDWYLINIPMNIIWFFMVQVVIWLYVLRIQSLGTYGTIDRYLKYSPVVVAIMQLPNLVINLARLNIESIDDVKYHYFVISSSVFSVCITIVEIAMFLILIKKLNFILEYKQAVLLKIGFHLKITCVAVIFLDVVMAIVRFQFPVDFSISPIIYLLRIYIIIQFYSDLLVSVNVECTSLPPRKDGENGLIEAPLLLVSMDLPMALQVVEMSLNVAPDSLSPLKTRNKKHSQ